MGHENNYLVIKQLSNYWSFANYVALMSTVHFIQSKNWDHSVLDQIFNCSIKEAEDRATVWTWSVCPNASGGRHRCFQAYFVLSLYELLKPPLKSNWVTSATAAVLGNEPDEGLQHTRTRKTRKCTDAWTAVNWTTRFSLLSRRKFSKDQLHLKKKSLNPVPEEQHKNATPEDSFNFFLFSKGALWIVSINIIFCYSHFTFRRVLFSLTVAMH